MHSAARFAPEAFREEYAATAAAAVALIENLPESALEEVSDREGDAVNALHYAAGCGCIEACVVLLRRCVGLNFQQDQRGRTPLLWAVEQGLVRTVELLLRYGADSLHVDTEGSSALHVAAALGFGRLCGLLVAAPGVGEDIDRPSGDGSTALHLAGTSGSEAACRALIEGGADPRAKTPEGGFTPLHLAAAKGWGEVVQYLASLDPEAFLAEDDAGRRPVDAARAGGHREAVAAFAGAEGEHERLVRKWSHALRAAGADDRLFDPSTPPLELAAPRARRVAKDDLKLTCSIIDVEYRIARYVLEVRPCFSATGPWPSSAPPARVYYAPSDAQRKIDEVDFVVPRFRPAGQELWSPGRAFQFRLGGVLGRPSQEPGAQGARRVLSPWSDPVLLPVDGGLHRPRRRSRRGGLARCAREVA